MALTRSLGVLIRHSSRLPALWSLFSSSNSADDLFLLFNLSRSYDIDQKELKKQYISLQRRLHPDKFAGVNKSEELLAECESSHVSRAYEIMKDDYRRGHHLLTLLGQHSDTQAEEQMDTSFLEEMMNLGEDVQSARSDEEREKLLASFNERLVQLNKQVSAAFASHEWPECRRLLSKIKFYQSLKSSLVEKM